MQAYRVGNTSVLSADVLYRPYIILRFRVYYALIKKSVYTSVEYPQKYIRQLTKVLTTV